MGYLIFSTVHLLLAFQSNEAWIPSKGFLYGVLVVGAMFLAGVALSVFTYYEDHYWNDKDFRERLRFNSSKKRA